MTTQRLRTILYVALSCCVAMGAVGCAEAEVAVPSSASSRYPTQLDLSNARAECLRELGWKVEVKEDGTSITEDIPDSQMAEYRAQDAECMKQLGVDTSAAPTRAQLESAYEYYVESVGCLREAGYEVDDAPSLQQFLDSYGGEDSWIPWLDVPPTDFADAKEACPLPPPVL